MHGLRQEYDSRHRHGMLPSSRSSSVAGSRPTTADSWQAYPHQPHITVQPSQTPMHSSTSLNSGDAASDIPQTVSLSWPFAQSPAPHVVATHGPSQSLVQQQPRRHKHDGIAGQQAHTGRSGSELHSAVTAIGTSLQEHQQTLSPIRTQQSTSSRTRSAHSQRILERLISVAKPGNMSPGTQAQQGVTRQTSASSPKSAARRVLYPTAPAVSSGSVNQTGRLAAADPTEAAGASRKPRLLPSHFDLFDSDSSSEDQDGSQQVDRSLQRRSLSQVLCHM